MLRRGVGASLSGLTSGFFGIFSSSKNIVRRTALPLQAWWALNRCVKKNNKKSDKYTENQNDQEMHRNVTIFFSTSAFKKVSSVLSVPSAT